MFKFVFKRSSRKYTGVVISAFIIVVAINFIDYLICVCLPDQGILMFIVKMTVCVIVAFVSHLIIFSRFKRFNQVIDLANRACGGKVILIARKFKILSNIIK